MTTARSPADALLSRRLLHLLGRDWASTCPLVRIEAPAGGGDEMAQAISGLMSAHGGDERVPRRLGIAVPSVAAAVLASQGALAGTLARMRGFPVRHVTTSLIAGALAFLHHHLALATCGQALPPFETPNGAGPPFRTADAQMLEIEALQGSQWVQFWQAVGVADEDASNAWLPFVFRFLTGRCALPQSLHDALGRLTASEIAHIGRTAGVSVCRVRSIKDLRPDEIDGDYWPAIAEARESGSPVADRGGACETVHAPLAGLRVVEVTSRLQGPLAAHLLRQLGAEVLKVEPPGGDFGRRAVPRAGNVGAAYLAYNRSKSRIELDYKTATGRAQLVDLVSEADVFVHNFPPGRAEALRLDAGSLQRVNPRLVYAHAAGWCRHQAPPCPIASDYVVQAHAALGDALYPVGEPPRPARLTLVDAMGGLLACEGILTALYRRFRSGNGQRVETSLFAGAMTLQQDLFERMPQRGSRDWGDVRPRWNALDQPIPSADGFLFVGPLTAQDRGRLAEACGLPDNAPIPTVLACIAKRAVAHWLPMLNGAGIPAVQVCTALEQLPADPAVSSWLESADDACWVPAAPWQFSL